jgi:Domain of unknown function (DUF4277)
MALSISQISVQDIDHCGIVAGIIDYICLVEQINQILGTHPQEIVTPGKAVKAIILNRFGKGECAIERQPLGQSGQAIS